MLNFSRDIAPYLKFMSGLAPGTEPVPPVNLRHAYYDDDVALAETIAKVFGPDYPDYLQKNRPKEQKRHKEYRKNVYENTFLSYPERIKTALDYIRQADDFDVEFPSSSGTDTLEDYTGKSFSIDGDLTTWHFREAVPTYIDDPNALELILPRWGTESDTQLVEPRVWIVPSRNIWMYRKGKLAVVLSPETHDLEQLDTDGQPVQGYTVFFCDHDSYTIVRQVSREATPGTPPAAVWDILGMQDVPVQLDDGSVGVVQQYNAVPHFGNTLPARKLGLKRKKRNPKGEEHFQSLISPALPHIRLAQGNQSDIQVEIYFHIGSQEWRRSTNKCPNPKCVAGHVLERVETVGAPDYGAVTGSHECPTCHGSGYNQGGSNLEIFWVPSGSDVSTGNPAESSKVPSGPPGGFIPRNIEPLQEFVKEYQRHKEESYACVNMQFVMVVPYAQSGVSKSKDREEMYRELNTQAAHIVELIMFSYTHIEAQRYGIRGKLGTQLPNIMVPVRFNLENSDLVREELKDALANKADPTIIEALQKKYLKYLVGEASDEYRRYDMRTRRDPFKDISDEMKTYLMGLQLRNPESPEALADIERIYLSIRFDGLVADALADDPLFFEKNPDAQYKTLQTLNKQYIGSIAMGATAGVGGVGKFAEVPPISLKPPVDIQQTDQVLEVA